MSRNRFIGLAFALFALALPATALAQATRTWVSGVGDDANPCSRTAPCKTWAGAISKTAVNGEIDALDPGGFGAVTIIKAITIDGGPGIAGVLVAAGNGINVNVLATDVVTLRNLDINGVGGGGVNGIHLSNGGTLNIENCQIYGFNTHGIDIVPAVQSNVTIKDTNVINNTGGGLFVQPAGGQALVVVDNSHFEKGQFGVRVGDSTHATVRHSVAFANVANGFSAVSAGAVAELSLENSVSSNNGVNGVATSGANSLVRISNMTIMDNTSLGLNSSLGGQIVSFGNNHIGGNIGGNGAPTLTVPSI